MWVLTVLAVPGWSSDLRWHDPFAPCAGNCAVYASLGMFTATAESNSFGLNSDFIPDGGDYVAPWNYDYEDSFLVSAAVSRRVLSWGDLASAELEAGLGQRFGEMHATEVWGALYFRWHAFPWNDVVRTSVAISTGLNYASRIEERERRRDGSGNGGAHLLHYLAPELTFALPERQDWELVFRYHHRSGGGAIFGDTLLFNGVTGGANFATAGLRYRF